MSADLGDHRRWGYGMVRQLHSHIRPADSVVFRLVCHSRPCVTSTDNRRFPLGSMEGKSSAKNPLLPSTSHQVRQIKQVLAHR